MRDALAEQSQNSDLTGPEILGQARFLGFEACRQFIGYSEKLYELLGLDGLEIGKSSLEVGIRAKSFDKHAELGVWSSPPGA